MNKSSVEQAAWPACRPPGRPLFYMCWKRGRRPLLLMLSATLLLSTAFAQSPDELPTQLLRVKRVYVDRLTGGETAAQMRDLLISSLQSSKLFILTENQEKADAFVRGAAEDLVYTDAFSSSENASGRRTLSGTNGTGRDRVGRLLSQGADESDSLSIHERKHEAIATIRLVNKDGDVMWSTTQESNGGKFRGASADVADKITKQLVSDYEHLRRPANGGRVP
jgi:hypothetical protein